MGKFQLFENRKWRLGVACGAGAAIGQGIARVVTQQVHPIVTALATVGIAGALSVGMYLMMEAIVAAREKRASR
jgi:hypothetical protein